MTTAGDVVVRLTPDPSALLEFLDTAAGALITAADTLRAAYPVAEPEPADRTGLCDHCDKPQTGGAAGGGISPEHWCDDHRPDDYALGAWDDDAPEPWVPEPGDRVTLHCPHVPLDGIEATVVRVFNGLLSQEVRVDAVTSAAGIEVGYTLPLSEVRPVVAQSPAAEGSGYEVARSEDAGGTSADEPARAVAPSVAGPEPLDDSLQTAYVGWLRSFSDDRATHEVAAAVVRERLAQYQGSTPVSQVFADWFGGDR